MYLSELNALTWARLLLVSEEVEATTTAVGVSQQRRADIQSSELQRSLADQGSTNVLQIRSSTVSQLAVRETWRERLAEQPQKCFTGFVGRFCYDRTWSQFPRGFYDECHIRHRREDSTGWMRETKYSSDCPEQTICAPVPPAEAAPWPMIVCVGTHDRRRRAPIAADDRQAAETLLEIGSSSRASAEFKRLRPRLLVASAALLTSAMQLRRTSPEGLGTVAPSTYQYTASVAVGPLDWHMSNIVGVSVPEQRSDRTQPVVAGPSACVRPHPDEPPSQRPRLSGHFTLTRNDDPTPICTTTERDEICASSSAVSLEEGDVLHVDFSAMEAMEEVLRLIAFDSAAFDATKPPPPRS